MKDFIQTEKFLNYYINDIKELLKRLRDQRGIRKNIENNFKFPDQNIAKHYFSNMNYSVNYRKMFFNSGIVWHYINEKQYGHKDSYWFPLPQICFVIFTDNVMLYELVYKHYCIVLSNKENMQYKTKFFLEIATSNWENLNQTFDQFLSIYDSYHDNFNDKHIYKELILGFLNKDSDKIEENLNLLESPKLRNLRIKEVSEEKYISVYTTALAKLAVMHDMEVNVDSKFVPNELLQFQPLLDYTIPYKFLRDFYREQGINWRYDPVHPELQDWANDPEFTSN